MWIIMSALETAKSDYLVCQNDNDLGLYVGADISPPVS